ncbi:uncharacterized protein LOC125599339 [Brassica napus]|uniref:uncharacterized protein LOC125599339 n=1 Tax=Brassica napus TaxID=3708 RepID=UPI002078C1AF|nr:uncharacterized protein LOC125599339 [Brassica napus]
MVFLDVAKLPPYRLLHQKYNLAEKLCYEDYLRRATQKGRLDETSYEEEEGLDGTPSFVEAAAVRRKTISVGNLPCPTVIRDIIDLYKMLDKLFMFDLLQTARATKMAWAILSLLLLKKQRRYCIDHNVWYEDQLGRENRLIDEELEEGFGKLMILPRNSAYYKNVGEVCRRVRLVVNREGEHVGCGFVEFASAVEAKKALLYESRALNIHIISDVVEMSPYPIRPKYNLAEKLWRNEEYLLPVSLPIEGDYLEKPEVTNYSSAVRG